MELILNLGFVLLGALLLYVGGEALVRGSASLAFRLKVPPLIVGLTVIAFGTSAPELLVCSLAAIQGKIGISVGNIIGSNIANIGLILGLAAIMAPILVQRSTISREIPFVFIVSLLYWAMAAGGLLSRVDGLILLVLFALFIGYCIATSRKSVMDDGDEEEMLRNAAYDVIYIVAGLVGLVYGSTYFVEGASEVARAFGVSEVFIGLSMVALGTSLPELVAAIIATKRGKADLAVGNVVGSNLFNILLVQGTVALIRPLEVDQFVVLSDFPIMTGFAALLMIFALIRPKLGRLQGFSILLGYCGYLAYITLRG